MAKWDHDDLMNHAAVSNTVRRVSQDPLTGQSDKRDMPDLTGINWNGSSQNSTIVATEIPPDDTPETIVQWARDTFGGTARASKIAARANKEMAELLMVIAEIESKSPYDPETLQLLEKAKSEVADILIVVMQLAPLLGFDLQKKINEKMQINRKRTLERADDGSYQHKKE